MRGQSGEAVPVKHPNLVLMSMLSPEPREVRDMSILRRLPFLGEVLVRIYHTTSINWDCVGSTHFTVTYKPSGEGDRAYGTERTRQIADRWNRAMRPGAGMSDFVTAGDVSIRMVGASN